MCKNLFLMSQSQWFQELRNIFSNLRGTIITVVSLDHLLEIETSNQKQKESHRSILINYKGTRFIIQTELIDEVQDIKESLIEPVSEDSNSVGMIYRAT